MVETDASEDPPSVIVQQGVSPVDETAESVVALENRRPTSDGRAPEHTPSERPDQEPGDLAKALQDTVNEIREWVAETPAANEAEEKTVAIEQGMTGIDLPVIEREQFAASYPEWATPGSHETPNHETLKSRDLQLTIGTISVTIEEPRSEMGVRSNGDQTRKTDNAGNEQRSRLARHYISTR
ncbi:MAG: hypothetical protein ACR2MC_09375 [Actinomycetota bacterium]